MLIDVIMWAGLALMVGFVLGFKLGTSLGGDGMDYHRGFVDGVNFHAEVRGEETDDA